MWTMLTVGYSNLPYASKAAALEKARSWLQMALWGAVREDFIDSRISRDRAARTMNRRRTGLAVKNSKATIPRCTRD
jgi:hypothetical protein